MKRTNVLFTEEQHKKLKAYSRQQGRTMGDLVREAVDTAYRKRDLLDGRRQVAVDAYREGFISLGKVAEVLGLDPMSAREHLAAVGVTAPGLSPSSSGRSATGTQPG
jgi:predicted HTH domain antitoxin